MSNLPVEDQRLISRYRAGVAVVESALSTLSDEDLDRSSGDEGWTARMVVHHLADSEARSYLRLRQLLVEPAPAAIQGYDEELWASSDVLGYETLPVGPSSIPHLVLGRYGAGQVLLKPAPEGTGVIAGGAVRAVMTSAGVQNVLTKSLGSPNPHNVVKATFDALVQLRDRSDVANMRGKSVEEL